MGSPTRPAVYTIPAHRGFADAFATRVVDELADGERGLSDTLILIPNNRAGRALTEAFVRCADSGLLLPRMAAGAALMPDAHLGYGLPIGGVLALRDAVCPYAVGVDIDPQARLAPLLPMTLLLHKPAAKRR